MKGMMKLHFYIISIPLPTQSRVTANSEEEAGGGGGGMSHDSPRQDTGNGRNNYAVLHNFKSPPTHPHTPSIHPLSFDNHLT